MFKNSVEKVNLAAIMSRKMPTDKISELHMHQDRVVIEAKAKKDKI